VLVSPANTSTGIAVLTAFSWSASSGAASYGLQVSTDPAFGSTVLSQTGLSGTSFTLFSPLLNNTVYYWRMNATNAGGTSGWTSSRSFTTVVPAPAAPVLVSPANASTGVSVLPSVAWSLSSGATSYGLQVSTDPTFASTVVNQAGLTGTSYTLTTTLLNNTLYYWRMNATNAGGSSLWSTPLNFTTLVAPPGSPTLGAPANGAINVALLTPFSWPVDPGSTSYGLQVSTDPAFGTTVVNQAGITGTSYTLASPLANGTVYYWRLNAVDAGGTSPWSSPWSFTTLPLPPSAPVLTSPADASTGANVLTSFAWNASTGATLYSIQVSTDPGFATTVVNQTGITGTSYTLSAPLANSQLYYWRMNATNAGGTSSWSAAHSFTSIATAPSAPTLVSPANGGTGVPLLAAFGWSNPTGSTSCALQVSTDPSFATTVVNLTGLTGTSYMLATPLAGGTVYYWRMNATNAGGTGAWSGSWSFTTFLAIPAAPVLVSPLNGTTGIAFNPVLQWNGSSGATTYNLQLATDAGFGTIVVNDVGIAATSRVPGTSLTTGTPYFWRVSATNSAGTSAWSSVWTFTMATFIPPPSVPLLVRPADSAKNVSVLPTLVWNSAAGASSHGVQIAFDSLFTLPKIVTDSIGIVADSAQITRRLLNDTLYYWRVNASNVGGTSGWSTIRSFRTIISAPLAPRLISPADLATGISLRPNLVWSRVATADSVHLEVATDEAFTNLILDRTGITDTTIGMPLTLSNGTTYHWRMNAANVGGESAWSDSWQFTTIVAVPPSPQMISPADAATAVPVLASFKWKAQAGAMSYGLQVSTDPGFATTTASQTGLTDTTFTLAVRLASNTLYYWRVNATNSVGTSTWAAARSFRTEPASAVEQLDGMLPTQYALLQNFPNPFNPTTTIRFEVPKEGFVELKVYDAVGKEVATILSNYLTAGRYQIRWNAAGNASGVYFYRLVSQDYSSVKKLILMK
jgi:hypothetical protein